MSSSKKKAPASRASTTLTAKDAEAQSVLRMNEWLSQVDQAERLSTGTWFNIPAEFQGWIFMRAGLRGVDRAEAFAAQMRRMGYVDAPRGTMCAGFETDGERGLYLMIPKAGYRLVQERKKGVRRSVQSATSAFESTVSSINSLGGGVTAQVRTSESEIKADL